MTEASRKSRWVGITVVIAMVATCMGAWAQEKTELAGAEAFVPDRAWEVIDVAIALDTSTSMDKLIETARVKLWEIVHDLTLVEPTPTLRVALLTFGNNSNDPKAGWVKVEADFTEDLDLVSERLFELTSDGGAEYIGRVLKTALNDLSWTPSDEALKLLFVTGNEPADQDPKVALADMTEVALDSGISVQAIYCGRPEEAAAESWVQLAEWSLGQFATIDHLMDPVSVETPFDTELAELSGAINKTYIPLGEDGQKRHQKLAEQDNRARELSPASAASRAAVKSAPLYSAGWDLVDAVGSGRADLYELDESELPEAMQSMSLREREIHVQDMQAKRLELRERIAVLSEERRQYVAQELEAKGIDTSRAFDTVVREAIREKLEERGFEAPGG